MLIVEHVLTNSWHYFDSNLDNFQGFINSFMSFKELGGYELSSHGVIDLIPEASRPLSIYFLGTKFR